MDQKIIDLFDKYTHGQMDRRDFLERLTKLAGSTAAAMAVLPLLQSDWAQAAIVDPNDARLATERVTFDSPKGKISGYLARPKSRGKRPTVLVIHENRGLNPHLEDVARRFAAEGFLAYAIDLLSLVGGTPANEEEALKLHPKMNVDDAVATLVAAVSFLKKHPESNGKVGAVGFCFGGLMVNRLAASSKELDAGVAYYGRQVPGRAGQEHHRVADAALRGEGRRRERRHRGLRSRAEGQQQEVHAAHVSGHAARLQQRPRRRALQQGRRRPRLGPHAGVLQGDARRAAQRGA